MKQKIELEELDPKHWKPTHIFPDCYLVSDEGQVYSIRARKLLRLCVREDGRYTCVLAYKGKNINAKVHRLVAMAFIPNPENKPQVDHINGIVTDNRASNLRWVTSLENARNPVTLAMYKENRVKRIAAASKKRYKVGIVSRKPVKVYRDGELVGIFESVKATEEFLGFSKGVVSYCLSGRHKNSKGYTFKLVDDKI